MKIKVETTKTYTVLLTEEEKQSLCDEINKLYGTHAVNQFLNPSSALKTLETCLKDLI